MDRNNSNGDSSNRSSSSIDYIIELMVTEIIIVVDGYYWYVKP